MKEIEKKLLVNYVNREIIRLRCWKIITTKFCVKCIYKLMIKLFSISILIFLEQTSLCYNEIFIILTNWRIIIYVQLFFLFLFTRLKYLAIFRSRSSVAVGLYCSPCTRRTAQESVWKRKKQSCMICTRCIYMM